MHSRIIQVSEKPITKDLMAEDYDIPEWFIGEVADYTSIMEDEEAIMKDYHWAFDRCSTFDDENKSFKFDTEKIDEIINDRLEKLKKLSERLSVVTTKEMFLKELQFLSFDIRGIYEDKFGFYIFSNDDEYERLIPLDRFMWENCNNTDKTFYVGSVFDYHF